MFPLNRSGSGFFCKFNEPNLCQAVRIDAYRLSADKRKIKFLATLKPNPSIKEI